MVDIIAHRGSSGYKLENTSSSFELATKQKVDYVEFDVQMTKDGIFVVCHDNFLFRLSKRLNYISNLTFKQLEHYPLYNSFFSNKIGGRILSLQETLEILKNKKLNIELKNSCIGQEREIVDIVFKKRWPKEVIFSSFNDKILINLSNTIEDIQIGAITSLLWKNKINLFKKIKGFSIHPHYSLVSEKLIKLSHQNNLKVYPFTVNNSWRIRKMVKIGADGIITNYPDKAAVILNEMHKS